MLEGYEIKEFGIIHQNKIFREQQNYDIEYIESRYGKAPVKLMSEIRINYLEKYTKNISSVLDVGCGAGDFLYNLKFRGIKTFGYDVVNYPLDESITRINNLNYTNFDCITFFDSLEHIEDISFVKTLRSKYVLISLPWCHYLSDDWFYNWKHRRPDEHLWHFSSTALIGFMDSCGFNCLNISNVEDEVRKSSDYLPNILTAIFERKRKL